MRQTTYPKVVLHLLSVLLVVLLAACGSVPTESLSAASSGPAEFRLRGMTSTIAVPFDTGYINEAMVFAEYTLQGDLNGQQIPLVITGPAGWNGGQPYEILAKAEPENALIQLGDRWKLSFSPEIPTVPGVYTATTTVAGQTYTSTLDVSSGKMLPSVVGFTASAVADKIDVSWEAVPGAKEYYVTLLDESGEVGGMYTTETSVSFADFGMPLDTTKNFSISLNALSEVQSTYLPENGDEMPVNYSVSYDVLENIFGNS
jgi:hypothetical protein